MITQEDCRLLKKHGFQWYKNHCTDRVESDGIQSVVPAAKGFTVIYKNDEKIVLVATTATIDKIEYPENLEKEWIRVHWDTITDERKETS